MPAGNMKGILTREFFWLLAAVILTALIGLAIFGKGLFDSAPVDVHLYDTYYVFPKTLLLAVTLIGVLTTAYVARGVYFKLDNKFVNGILAILLSVVLGGLIIKLIIVNISENHLSTLYADEMGKRFLAGILSSFRIVKGVVWTLIGVTATILIAAGYKTFKPRNAE